MAVSLRNGDYLQIRRILTVFTYLFSQWTYRCFAFSPRVPQLGRFQAHPASNTAVSGSSEILLGKAWIELTLFVLQIHRRLMSVYQWQQNIPAKREVTNWITKPHWSVSCLGAKLLSFITMKCLIIMVTKIILSAKISSWFSCA